MDYGLAKMISINIELSASDEKIRSDEKWELFCL